MGHALPPVLLALLPQLLELLLLLRAEDVPDLPHLFLDEGAQLLGGLLNLGSALLADV